MRLARKTHYGIQMLMALADRSDEWVSLHQLSQELKISLPFLKHIAAALKRTRLLVSQGGIHGGYRLARPAEEITLATIFKSLNETIRLVPCRTKQCNHQKCGSGRFWETVGNNLTSAFEQTTLKQVIRTAASATE